MLDVLDKHIVLFGFVLQLTLNMHKHCIHTQPLNTHCLPYICYTYMTFNIFCQTFALFELGLVH